jgi:hypothetical protein
MAHVRVQKEEEEEEEEQYLDLQTQGELFAESWIRAAPLTKDNTKNTKN